MELSFSWRFSDAHAHYRGVKHDLDREREGNNVENIQNLFDLRASVVLSERWSLFAGLPYLSGDWSLPLPATSPPGPRWHQETEGFGDLVLGPRFWLLRPSENPHGNLQAGIGLKCPTGREDLEVSFPDASGGDIRPRAADVSVQPGDGGWGALFDLQGFRDWGPVRLFASGTYLVNPREQNGTPSTPAELLGPAAVPSDLRRNSVADQFLLQAGGSVGVVGPLSASLALRWEGVPPRDLVGGEEGFRRPGYAVLLAPGIAWSGDGWSASFSFLWTVGRNSLEDAGGRPGDATFPDWSVTLGVTVQF